MFREKGSEYISESILSLKTKSSGVTPHRDLKSWKLHVKLHNHGKLCKCVLLTTNDRLSWK